MGGNLIVVGFEGNSLGAGDDRAPFRETRSRILRPLVAVGLVVTGIARTAGASCASSRFGPASNFPVGTTPVSVAVGDFNGDGIPDLATANYSDNDVSVLLGDGAGNFGSPTNFPVGPSAYSVAVGDFNLDGKLDLAVANINGNFVSVLLGNGAGSFGPPINLVTGANPNFVAIGDFNADGKPDLAVSNQSDGMLGTVAILLGHGDGTFGAAMTFGVGMQPYSIAVGDFNGDGNLDLAIANRFSNDIGILPGDGSGGFGAATSVAVGNFDWSVVAADFNADGKLDLAVTNQNDDDVSILLGHGDGTFAGPANFGVGARPSSLAVADFNGDGKLDLVVSDYGGASVSVLFGDGSGGFGAPTNLSVGSIPVVVVAGDFNGDGRPDIAVENQNNNDVSIILNESCSTTITSVTGPPSPVALGGLARITADFTDAGTDETHSCTVSWGDASTSSGTVTETGGGGSCSAMHTYSETGVYTVSVAVADSCGTCQASAQLQFVVVYDPNGAFVTGGGWIDSPAGAYSANAALTGRANFGFVSKYVHGATIPTGNTEFNFSVAGLNFQGSSYQWLVISGAKARYRGTGAVNGSGSYGFELTAWDGQAGSGGGTDRFRIRIWNQNQGNAVVYDNQMGAPDGTDPTTVLEGGSIVIHQ